MDINSRLVLCLAFMLVSEVLAAASDDKEPIEEVVVTGSYLRYAETFDHSSPLRILDEQMLQEQGNVDLTQIMMEQSFSMGGNARAGLTGGNLNGVVGTSIRGLGPSNTLSLINGKRLDATNGSQIAPRIAIKRVETLLDGASALYGSEAIAGVVNYITRTDFEGFEVRMSHMSDTDSHLLDQNNLSLIAGRKMGDLHLTFAYEWLEQGNVTQHDRDLPNVGDSFFGKTYRLREFANPVGLGVHPDFAAAYNGPAGFNQDLNCADDPGSVPFHSGVACGANFSPFFPISNREDRKLMMLTAEYEISDSLMLYGSLNHANSELGQTVSSLPWTSFLPVIPTHNPGLIEDARRRGVPAGTPLTALAFIGRHTLGLPGRTSTGTEGDEFRGNLQKHDAVRWMVGSTGELPFAEGWEWDFSLQNHQWLGSTLNNTNIVRSRANFALAGLGGPDCDRTSATNIANALASLQNVNSSGCHFYNPFLNAQFTESGTNQTDQNLRNNPTDILNWIDNDEGFNSLELKVSIVNLVVKGALGSFRGRDIGLATGIQYRKGKAISKANDASLANDLVFGSGSSPVELERSVQGIFAEVALPLSDVLDVQLALRHERYGKEGLSTTNPKLAMLWTPIDDLSVRMSFSSSFRPPGQTQLDPTNLATGNRSVSDPLFGGATFSVPVTTRGNADLKPVDADVVNLGLSWYPSRGVLAGLRADVDFFSHDYSDIIVGEVAQVIINGDPNDPRITRGPTGLILDLATSFTNTGGSNQEGIQYRFGYGFDMGRIGRINLGLDGLHLTRMDMNLFDASCGCNVDIDGLGRRNHDNPFGAIQKNKLNAVVRWTRENHNASITWRFVDDYLNSGLGSAGITSVLEQERGYGCTNADGSRNVDGAGCKIDSHSTVDVQYSLRLPGVGDLESAGTATIGAINLFDEDPPAVAADQGFDASSHDARGRLVYLRYKFNL